MSFDSAGCCSPSANERSTACWRQHATIARGEILQVDVVERPLLLRVLLETLLLVGRRLVGVEECVEHLLLLVGEVAVRPSDGDQGLDERERFLLHAPEDKAARAQAVIASDANRDSSAITSR